MSSCVFHAEGRDFFKDLNTQLKHIKPPARVLEEGKLLGRVVQSGSIKPDDGAKAVASLQQVVAQTKPNDIQQIAAGISQVLPKDLQKSLREDDVKKVSAAITEAAPKITEAFKHSDPQKMKKMAEALRNADPKDLEDVIVAVGVWHDWKQFWYMPILGLIAMLVTMVCTWQFLRRRCRRGKRPCVVLAQSDERLLDVEEPMLFQRAACPAVF